MKGFTLIELIVTITILIILGTVLFSVVKQAETLEKKELDKQCVFDNSKAIAQDKQECYSSLSKYDCEKFIYEKYNCYNLITNEINDYE